MFGLFARWKRSPRFQAACQDTVDFYRLTYGDGALTKLEQDLQRPNLRTKYRNMLREVKRSLEAQQVRKTAPRF